MKEIYMKLNEKTLYLIIIRLQSNSFVTLGFVLSIITERLSQMAKSSSPVDPKSKSSKSLLVKSIPSSTVEYLLSCIEKHHSMKTEMKDIVVSWRELGT